MWVTGVFLWKDKHHPKAGSAQLSLPQWLHPGWERHWAVRGGSKRCLDKAFSLEAFLGDMELSGSFKSRLCQIQRGRKSAIFQLSASVSKSKFAYWSCDLQNDSLQRLNPPPSPRPPRLLYLFCLFVLGLSFQISPSLTVRLVAASPQLRGGADLLSLPIR